ncbi:MAG: cupredoxin domain-containing protein [Fidelibacterota bacterium]
MRRILWAVVIVLGLSAPEPSTARDKHIELRAKRFAYSPSVITASKGDRLIIKLISQDVTHGFFLDGYGTEFFVNPGETREVVINADKTGKFTFRCSKTCGEFHPYMVGYLKVLPNTRYYASVFLVAFIGLGSLGLSFRKRGNPNPAGSDRLFGFIPLNLRFELTRYRPVRALLKSRWFPFVPIIINLFVFAVILLAGFVGGLSAGNYNFGIMIVWILWWVLLMIVMVPVIGRLWCMVCPFPLFGDWLQRGKLIKVGRQKSWGLNKRWPNEVRNLWPLVILFFVATWFSGFFTVRPFATFLLLSFIIGAATIVAAIYGKRTFCLFLCPVSGFQGLYSNFSLCEVRVKDPDICKEHKPKTCVVGNEKGYGCPWMEQPYDINRNTYCGMCMECFKTCPYDNMALNLRPFGADFLAERKPTDRKFRRRGLDEAFKALTMLGIFLVFFRAFQSPAGEFKDMVRATTLGGYISYLAEATFVDFLFIPAVFLLFVYLSRKLSKNQEVKIKDAFVNFSYCLVPVGLAVWGAFSIGIILPNGSYLLHILSDPFGWGWNLFGTAKYPWTPVLTGAMPYLQVSLVIVGLMFALDYGFKFSRQTYATVAEAKRGWIPMVAFLVGLHIFFVRLFVA